jgi:hypothetical protein
MGSQYMLARFVMHPHHAWLHSIQAGQYQHSMTCLLTASSRVPWYEQQTHFCHQAWLQHTGQHAAHDEVIALSRLPLILACTTAVLLCMGMHEDLHRA